MNLPTTSSLLLDLQGNALTIWLNRVNANNALNDEMTQELMQVFDAARNQPEIRTIVLRGKGGVFCAGGDIKSFRHDFQRNLTPAKVASANRVFGDLLLKVNTQPQVVIVLVEGAAIGGGLGLACVGDITITTIDAQFRLSETSLGIPPAQIAPFVTERLGLTQARRLMLTGARFDGQEAVRFGLAHYAVKDSDELAWRCTEIQNQINKCAPQATAVTKEIIFNSLQDSRANALDFAADKFAAQILSEEGREGVAAFLQKRKPKWADG